MRRSLALPALLALAGCKTPTEVVVKLEAAGNTPSLIDVRLHRAEPFNGDPTGTLPSFVTPFLDGADLVLQVTPQGTETVMSLLPPASGWKDLMVSASASGYAVDPADPQDGSFADNVSKTILFTFATLPPDLGAPPDQALRRDLAAPPDLTSPVD